ncbi:hypothetical protein FSST1_003711 [Fusarium sambucinum]
MTLTPPSLGCLPVVEDNESQPRPFTTMAITEPTSSHSEEIFPTMEETLDKLGLGKDCDKSIRRRFNHYRVETFKQYKKAHEIPAESLTDWSKEECRNYLRAMVLFFLHEMRGSSFWSQPARKTSQYILSNDRDREIIGDSAECAIDIDNLSDDDVLPRFVPESSPDRVPKREPVTDGSGIEQNMMPQQETFLPKQSPKRPAEAEPPQAQSRAKSLRLDALDSSVGLPNNLTGEEESLFVSDDELIRDQLVDCNSSEIKQDTFNVECDGLPGDLPANAEHAVPQTLEENNPTTAKAEPAEPAVPQTLEENNPRDVTENIQNNPPKDSVPERTSSSDVQGTIFCKPLREKVTSSPYNPYRPVFEKETETPKAGISHRKKTKVNAVSRFRSRLNSPMYVPEQTYTPPVFRDAFVFSGPSEPPESSAYLETKTTNFTPDGMPADGYSDSFFTTNPPLPIKVTNVPINHVIDNKDGQGRAIGDKTDKAEELPYKKAFTDSSLNKNPYQSVVKIPMASEKGLFPENKLNFDSEHAKHVLDSHLRNHAKGTTTPIRFSFSLRHSNSHTNRINNISSFDFFTMSLREFVVALPLKDKDQISGLCIRQYGPITHLRQVYLYNEDVFGNIRDEFIRYIESDISDAKCTGRPLDYEISIEPIMDD